LRDNYLTAESAHRQLQNVDNSFENNVINKSNYSTELIGMRAGNDKSSLSIILPENQNDNIKEEGMIFDKEEKRPFQIDDSGEEYI